MGLTADSYSENMESNVKAWCVGFLNTDCTDYTDYLLENTEFFVNA